MADANQHTGRRVHLPVPQDCALQASDCEDVAVLNQLDGFNLQARISVHFPGDIDPTSISTKTVFLVTLRARTGNEHGGEVVGINYIVWDPTTRELSFRPETSLDQHTTYALVVTTGVRDGGGHAVRVAEGFRRYRDDLGRDADPYYRRALVSAEERTRRTVAPGVDIAALSVFTTQTATHIVERMREAIYAGPAPTFNFNVGPAGARAVFPAAQIAALTNNAQTTTTGPPVSQTIPLPSWSLAGSLTVGTAAFGSFRTLDFTTRPSGHITPIATPGGALAPDGEIDVAFNFFLPAGPRPAGGWPVAVFRAGSFSDKNAANPLLSILNAHGFAVLSFNGYGRGLGAATTMTVRRNDGTAMTFPAPGLGYDQNADGEIATWEPMRPLRPHGASISRGRFCRPSRSTSRSCARCRRGWTSTATAQPISVRRGSTASDSRRERWRV